MAKHIYLENNLTDETYFWEIDTLTGSYFEKINENYIKAIITSVSIDFKNSEKYWCVEIVEEYSFPIIKYYHCRKLQDLVSTYYANGYNFILKARTVK